MQVILPLLLSNPAGQFLPFIFAVDKGGLGVSSSLVLSVLRKVLFILSENVVHG